MEKYNNNILYFIMANISLNGSYIESNGFHAMLTPVEGGSEGEGLRNFGRIPLESPEFLLMPKQYENKIAQLEFVMV